MKKLFRSFGALLLVAALFVSSAGFTSPPEGAGTGDAGDVNGYKLNYRDEDIYIPEYTASDVGADDTLPSLYDMRDYGYLPTVRNQATYGTCWSFATVASAESNMIKSGIANTSIDLSEVHLAYVMYNGGGTSWDPLGLCNNDYSALNTDPDYLAAANPEGFVYHDYEYYLDSGGNMIFSSMILPGWLGLANESAYPYPYTRYTESNNFNTLYMQSRPNDVGRVNDAVHITGTRIVNNSQTGAIDAIKALVYNVGSVATSYYHNNNSMNKITDGANAGHYYYHSIDLPAGSGKYPTNHAVSIVGWNDSIPASCFKNSNGESPSINGGWLIRNSWDDKYDNGYFWMSYAELSWLGSSSYAFTADWADNYDNVYQYDGSGMASTVSIYGQTAYMANVYTCAQDETLDAVGFYSTGMTNVGYEVSVYVNQSSSRLPYDSAATPSAAKSGSTTYAGYYTAQLDTPVTLTAGDTFAVVVKLTDGTASEIKLNYDTTYDYGGNAWIKFNDEQAAGQSFFSASGTNGNWYDAYDNGMTMRVKAFTTAKYKPVTTLSFDESEPGKLSVVYTSGFGVDLGSAQTANVACSVFNDDGLFTGFTSAQFSSLLERKVITFDLKEGDSAASAFLLSDDMAPYCELALWPEAQE